MAIAIPDVTTLADLVSAHERAIAVEPALTSLLPDGGLRRGQLVGCRGVAARSLALSILSRPVADGAWLAVVGIDDFGVEAAIEHGLAPERVVAIRAEGAGEWADRISAAADGFELILTCPPDGAERVVRRVAQRVRARGSVLLTVPAVDAPDRVPRTSPLGHDLDLVTGSASWVGLGNGHGRLAARRVTIRSSGRRMPQAVTVECWLPGPDGRVDVVQTGSATVVAFDDVSQAS